MLETLMNSPVAWFILALMTVISFVYAFYCQKVNKERKELSYTKATDVLIYNHTTKFEKLNIHYGSEPIDNLCVTKIAVWNSGNRVLQKEDFVKKNTPSITALNGSRILEASIIMESEKTNKFHLLLTDNEKVSIGFDYIDKDNGAIIQIIHTGTKNELDITSMIKGGEPIKQVHKEKTERKKRRIKPSKNRFVVKIAFCAFYFFYGLICIGLGIFSRYRTPISDEEIINKYRTSELLNAGFIIAMGVLIIFGTAFILSLTLKETYLGMPSKLKKAFTEEDD